MRSLSPTEVPQLEDGELRHELEERGIPVGPITNFTRPLLVKMLLTRLGFHTNNPNNEDVGERSDGWASQAVESNADASDFCDAARPVYTFFGVYLPKDSECTNEETDLLPVYTDKAKCLAALKKHKGSRFKTFSSYDEAFHFSHSGPEVNQNMSQLNTTVEQDTPDGKEINSSSQIAETVSLEKPSVYRGPTSQDRVKFRKAIEKGDVQLFNQYVCSNPRYLVSSSDSPTILKEGSRYNCLHVACLAGQHVMCALILQHISQPRLFQLLYPDDTPDTSTRRQQFLLDLYLNMPDKGLNETPLHIACKQGELKCVKLLTAYAACDNNTVNKYGDRPKDVVCKRYSGANAPEVRASILELLEPLYYVPVLRDHSFTLPPVVGELYSPNVLQQEDLPEFAGDISNASFSFLNVSNCLNNTNNSLFDTSHHNSLLDCSISNLNGNRRASVFGDAPSSRLNRLCLESPLTCTRKVEAFLGPLPLSKALSVRKRWRMASRPLRSSPVMLLPSTPRKSPSPPTSTPQHSGLLSRDSKHQELAREMCLANGVASTPKRKPLATGAEQECVTPKALRDGASQSGVENTPKHADIRLPDYQKGLEVVGRRLAEEFNTSWLEYWGFLGEFINLGTPQGKSRLEEHLKGQYSKVISAEQSIDLSKVSQCLSSCASSDTADEGVECHGNGSAEPGANRSSNNNTSSSNPYNATERVTVVLANLPAESKGQGKVSSFFSAPCTPKNLHNNSSNSSLGSLCRGLEAIRLNASMSPVASHYSPAAQKRYEELLTILLMEDDSPRVHDLVSSMSAGHHQLHLTTDQLDQSLRSANWQLLSYVAQSCRVTARQLASALEDLVHEAHERSLSQLALVRVVKAKMAGEVLALHVIITRCCAATATFSSKNDVQSNDDAKRYKVLTRSASKREESGAAAAAVASPLDDSINGLFSDESNGNIMEEGSALEKSISGSGASIIHGLVTVETLKLLSDSLMPNDLLSLMQLMKSLVSNLDFIEIASSDEDDEDSESKNHNFAVHQFRNSNEHQQQFPGSSGTKRDQAMHLKCLVVLLERALSLATQDGHEDKCARIPSILELGDCNCSWDNCCVTLAALAEYAASGAIAHNNNTIDRKVVTNGGSASCSVNGVGESKVNASDNDSKRHSTGKYKAAHSFLHQSVFGGESAEKFKSQRSMLLNTTNDGTALPAVVKHLSFDEDATDAELKNPLTAKSEESANEDPVNASVALASNAKNDDNTQDHGRIGVTNANNDSGHPDDEGNGGGDERMDDDNDNDSFATAASSSINSSLATPDEAREVYINGTTPSKVDLDVLRALECGGSEEDGLGRVDEQQYPYLAQWQVLMQEKLEQEKNICATTTAADGDDIAVEPAWPRRGQDERQSTRSSLFESPYCHKPRCRLLSTQPLMTSSPLPPPAHHTTRPSLR